MDSLLLQGFVQQSSLEAAPFAGCQIRISGHIACLGRIVIMVIKNLDIMTTDADPLVVTRKYSYNAFVAGYGAFLRNDNDHAHEGHDDEHHCHVMNWRDGSDLIKPRWCGRAGWPHLSDFVGSVSDWYDEHRDELPFPDDVVDDLGLYDERTSVR